jgi:hypothetical protein
MAANVTISGVIGQILAPETFTGRNGNQYTYQGVVIDTQGYQRTDPVYVKFNVDRTSTASLAVGQPISVECNCTSRSYVSKTGVTMWNTDLMVWKINQAAQPQQSQQQVAQQPTSQVQQPTQQAQQPTPQQKDDDLPF